MKRLFSSPRLRPLRSIFYILLILVLLPALYISLSCPTLSMRQEFRRAEKANMIGPGRIVQILDKKDYREFEEMYVAETEYGISFFGRYPVHVSNHTRTQDYYAFSYRAKTGDITLAAAPNIHGSVWFESGQNLPVYLFTEYTQAVRATVNIHVFRRLETEINGTKQNYPINVFFYQEAERETDSFFFFDIKALNQEQTYALVRLSNMASGGDVNIFPPEDITIQATVQLYDAQNNLIMEKNMDITY